MDASLKANKQIIREFIREHYSDENLCQALAHARDGKMSWHSCCCLIGLPTADHALQGEMSMAHKVPHYQIARYVKGAQDADSAYGHLAGNYYFVSPCSADAVRRRRLIPIIKAEIKRRDRLANVNKDSEVKHCDEPVLIAR